MKQCNKCNGHNGEIRIPCDECREFFPITWTKMIELIELEKQETAREIFNAIENEYTQTFPDIDEKLKHLWKKYKLIK